MIGGLRHLSALRMLSILEEANRDSQPRLTAQSLRHLVAALGNMQQLRKFYMVQVLGLSMSGACALLLSLSPRHFTELHVDMIAAHSGMPAGRGKARVFGSALQRLTSLQHLALIELATDPGDAEHMSAAAAVASALPHLEKVSLRILGASGGACGLTVFGRRAAALSILSLACLAPLLLLVVLIGLLQGDDRVQAIAYAKQMLQRVMPDVLLLL